MFQRQERSPKEPRSTFRGKWILFAYLNVFWVDTFSSARILTIRDQEDPLFTSGNCAKDVDPNTYCRRERVVRIESESRITHAIPYVSEYCTRTCTMHDGYIVVGMEL